MSSNTVNLNIRQEDLYTPGCIRTSSGIYIDPCNPDPDKILIEDIAHALSHQPRFGGHLPKPYCVAQHCVEVAAILPRSEQLAGLLHDASEAYLIDVPRPVKERLANYREIEDRLMRVIADKFGFEWPLSYRVKVADEQELQREWHVLMLNDGFFHPIEVLDASAAKQAFLTTFKILTHDTK